MERCYDTYFNFSGMRGYHAFDSVLWQKVTEQFGGKEAAEIQEQRKEMTAAAHIVGILCIMLFLHFYNIHVLGKERSYRNFDRERVVQKMDSLIVAKMNEYGTE